MTAAEAAARRLLDDSAGINAERLAAEAATVDADALAWALKDACYAAWMREPALARRCADALALFAAQGPAPGSDLRHALAAWTEGIAALTEGRMAPALQHLDEAGAAFTALGDTQHAAETEVPKLIALSMLGRHEEALQAAQRAHSRFIATGDNAAAGKVELNLGSMLLHQDRYAEAARHYRAAALRFARLGDNQHSVMADIGLATVLTWQFAFDDAELMYERAAERAMSHGLPMLQGVIAGNRGRLELHRGRHAAALRWLEAALREFEGQGNPQRLAEARRDLADAYLALNLLPEATALYDAAIRSGQADDAPLEQAWAAVQRAQALAGQGALDAALRDLATARALFTSHPNAVGLGLVALRRAVLDLQRGAPDAALAGAEEASAAFTAAGIAGWRWDAEALAAEALAAAGRHEEAATRFAQTLEAAAGLAETEARCHTGLGLLQRASGDRTGARASLQRAVDTVESQRAGLHADAFRTAYGTDRQRAHEALVELALDDTDPGAAARQLQCMEQARARALLPGAGDGSAGSHEAGAARENWRWLHEQWQAAVAAGQGERAAVLLLREREAEAQWLEACRRADAAAPGTASAQAHAHSHAPVFDVGALQAALPPGTALVAYMQLGERWLACVATRDAVHSVTLPGDGLDDRIERLRFQLDTLRHGPAALRARSAALAERTTAHLAALHRQLWAPLLPWLQGAGHVIVVPHRALHCVPFCALHDGRHHLVEQHALSLAPSAALWLAGAAAPARPLRRALAIGVGAAAGAGMGGPALPHVAGELQQVAAAFDGRASVLLDAQATLPALRAALPGADVLHIACHGQFRADSPYFSSLHLADGPLTLRDAAALPLQAALVTLSACETGLNRIAPGDELLGLVRGFLLAGAPSVMASLWTVDDASTAALMGGFYRRLAANPDAPAAAQALREAQVEALATQAHPYFWAAFSLHGRG